VYGNQARALLDPGCEEELVLSTSFATSCGIHSQVDDDILVEFPDGMKVPSAAIEIFNVCRRCGSSSPCDSRGVGFVRGNPMKSLSY
jgi:hypothetical protein